MDDLASVSASTSSLSSLGEQLRALVGIGKHSVALVFEEGDRLDHHHVAALARLLEDAPGLEELVLVHTSPGIGFVASALALRVPRVRVRTSRKLLSRIPQPDSSERPLAVVDVSAQEELNGAIKEAIERVAREGHARVALVLPPNFRAQRGTTETLVKALFGASQLKELNLVHPGPSGGFMASSVGLVMPRLKVRAFNSLADVPR